MVVGSVAAHMAREHVHVEYQHFLAIPANRLQPTIAERVA